METGYLMDELFAEAIADGHHIPAELFRMLVKIKGTDRICLVTDAIKCCGQPEGEAVSGGLPPLIQRQFYMQKEKRRNAQAAAGLIQNGETIFLDASTTVQHIVPFLADKKDLTVITNSLFLAGELTKYVMEIICLGGRVDERPYVLDSEDTVENAMKYRVDKMFFSLGKVTLRGEVGNAHYLLYKTMLKNSKERYLLTDRAKVVEEVPKLLCDFSALTGVISDFAFPAETRELYPDTRFFCTAQ
jgi:DeoR/GlpR family transcriptional regulator of sugar metabolism